MLGMALLRIMLVLKEVLLLGETLPRAFAPQLHSANASPVCGRGQQSQADYSAPGKHLLERASGAAKSETTDDGGPSPPGRASRNGEVATTRRIARLAPSAGSVAPCRSPNGRAAASAGRARTRHRARFSSDDWPTHGLDRAPRRSDSRLVAQDATRPRLALRRGREWRDLELC